MRKVTLYFILLCLLNTGLTAQIVDYDYTKERLKGYYENYKEYYQKSDLDGEEISFSIEEGLSKEQIDSVKLIMANFKISKNISFGNSATLSIKQNTSSFDTYKNYGSVSFKIEEVVDTKGNQIAYPYTILNFSYIDDFNMIINDEEMAHFDVKATSNTTIAKVKGTITFTYENGYDCKLTPLNALNQGFSFDGIRHKIVDVRENRVSFLINKDKDQLIYTLLKDKNTSLSHNSTLTSSSFSPILYDYIFDLPFNLTDEQVFEGFNKKSEEEKEQLLTIEENYGAIKTIFFKGNAKFLLVQKKRPKKVISVPFEKLVKE